MTYYPVLYRIHIFKNNGLLLHRMLLQPAILFLSVTIIGGIFIWQRPIAKRSQRGRHRKSHTAKGEKGREEGKKMHQFSSLWLNEQWVLLHTLRQIQSARCILSQLLFRQVQAFAGIIRCIAFLLGFVCCFSRCLPFLWTAAVSTCFC